MNRTVVIGGRYAIVTVRKRHRDAIVAVLIEVIMVSDNVEVNAIHMAVASAPWT